MILNEVNFKGFFFFAFFEQPQRYFELPYDWISNFVFPELKLPIFLKKEIPCLHGGGCPLLVALSWVVEFPFSFVSRSSFYRHGTVPLGVGIPYLLSASLKPDEYFRRCQLERMAANDPDRKHFTKEGDTLEVKITENQSQKESEKSAINN